MLKKIKLFDTYIGKKEDQAVSEVLKSHFWASGAGVGYVSKFENSFKKYISSKNCVAVNSGTAALNLALSLIDLKNKEVIVPSLTFVSTVHAVILNGGKPVFADVDQKSLCLDEKSIESVITKRTKVVLPVHFGGMPCELDKIMKICKNNELILIEDAAHAAGSAYKKKKIGTHGMAVCFSFHPVKNLAMPGGGVISLNYDDHETLKKLNARRWCGITDRKNAYYDVKEIGWNYYMNEFSAAIGLIQLKKLEQMNKIRKKIASRYHQEINVKHKMPYNNDCSYHLFWIRVKNRDDFMKKMAKVGIETGIHYNPVHQMTCYKDKKTKLPITEKAGKEVVSLPMHPNLNEEDVDLIISSVNRFS
jgi:dTDP-4-amino-4,6-dideoxygalactose transaminase